MALSAVILAGFDGRYLHAIRKRLRREFPEGYVFRGAASSKRHHRSLYCQSEVEKILSEAADAVWGKSRRSTAFCRNPQRECAKKGVKRTCGKTERETCRLERPDRLILLYRADRTESRLLEHFGLSALSKSIVYTSGLKEQVAAEAAAKALRSLVNKGNAVAGDICRSTSPLLLPPRNFGSGAVRNLVGRVNDCSPVKQEVEKFRRENFDQSRREYISRRGIGFSAAKPTERHGVSSGGGKVSRELKANFRAGCSYPSDYHWDVQPIKSKLDGSLAFDCEDSGTVRPKKGYTNIWPDDHISRI